MSHARLSKVFPERVVCDRTPPVRRQRPPRDLPEQPGEPSGGEEGAGGAAAALGAPTPVPNPAVLLNRRHRLAATVVAAASFALPVVAAFGVLRGVFAETKTLCNGCTIKRSLLYSHLMVGTGSFSAALASGTLDVLSILYRQVFSIT